MVWKNIVIEIIGTCPLKCPSCLAYDSKDRDGMSLHEYELIIDKIAGDTLHITLSGGEPFAHPHLLDILKLTNEKTSIRPDIITSGHILPSNLKEYGGRLNYVRVSVKYANEIREDEWRGTPGSMRLLEKFLRECGKQKLPLIAHHVLDRQNTGADTGFDYIPDMLAFDKKYGIRPIFLPFIAYDPSHHHLMLSKREWDIISNKLRGLGYDVEMVEDKCTAGYTRACIGRNGSTRSCIYMPSFASVGNIFTESWETIKQKIENQRLNMEPTSWPRGTCPVFHDASNGWPAQARSG